MPKRERFTSPVKCPKCGIEGRAEWAENENPVYTNDLLNRELLSAPDGFELSATKDSSGDPQIQCKKCKVVC